MKGIISIAITACAVALTACTADIQKPADRPSPVTFEKVTLEDDFWLPRLKTQKETLVPFSLEKTEPAVENLRRVGEYLKHGKQEKMLPLRRYVASDLFKVMEGAAYLLALEEDAALEKQMDEIIDIIGDAQCPDGYLYELYSVPPSMRNTSEGEGHGRYTFVSYSHELYNMGHMYEAAVAYYRATGKRKFLDIAEKNAQHINKVFFEGDPAYNGGKPVNQAPGHQEIELALVKLYEATGNSLYLDMAKRFIDIRGVTYIHKNTARKDKGAYSQQHLPVRELRTAVGHAVRALYLYSGMADVCTYFNDTTLTPALNSIWHNIADTKIHITGGLGAVAGIEGFGPEYELPNKDAYDETCAAVGNVFFNYRMFLATKDAKYIDMAETSLYNNVLAGVNFKGDRFFYVNVLQADGKKSFNKGRQGRQPWFKTACCPSNIARLVPQVSGFVYSHTENDIFCGLYAGSSASIPLASGNVGLKQTTGYPFEGNVSIEVSPEKEDSEFTIWLRIPTWTTDRFMPGELYSYADRTACKVTAKVNGKRVRAGVKEGFMPIKRSWKKGDIVELDMDMPVRYNIADRRVKADSNRVSITRGPLVYCAEQPDNEHEAYLYYIERIGDEASVSEFTDGIMKGIKTISLDVSAINENGEGVRSGLKLIPYYAWNNRGDGTSMNIWFGRDYGTTAEALEHSAANVREVTATHTYKTDDVNAVIDGNVPKSSSDKTIPRWTSYPQKGKEQQITIILKKTQPIKNVSVYWYDDSKGVHIPESWSMEYRYNDQWKEYVPYITDSFEIGKDRFNTVHPDHDIEADALRLKIKPQPNAAAGILEIDIE